MKGAKEILADYPQEIAHRLGRLNPVPAQHTGSSTCCQTGQKHLTYFQLFRVAHCTNFYIPLLSQASTFNVGGPSRHPYARMNYPEVDITLTLSDKCARSKRGLFGPVTCRVLVASSDFSVVLYVCASTVLLAHACWRTTLDKRCLSTDDRGGFVKTVLG
jgi:hypothetical protein